jgi:hypothetical protein
MANLKELAAAFTMLAPVFRGLSHSLICGSSALAWLLAKFGVEVPVEDIDAVALTDEEFERMIGRLGDLERVGQFRFQTNSLSRCETLANEAVRRAAGSLLPCGIAFELFDRRSWLIGSEVIGGATTGAGIVRLSVGQGLDLPFADVPTLRRINDHVLRESERASGAMPASLAKLHKRRRWGALLDLLASEEGWRALGEQSNTH